MDLLKNIFHCQASMISMSMISWKILFTNYQQEEFNRRYQMQYGDEGHSEDSRIRLMI